MASHHYRLCVGNQTDKHGTDCGDAAGDTGPQTDAPPQDDASVQEDATPQTDVLQVDVLPQDDAEPQTDVLPQADGPYTTAGWHNLTPGTLPPAWPPPRSHHAMSYDRARHRAVLFGGESTATVFNDTWEWDGSVWALRDSSPAPLGPGNCSNHVMVYDAARGVSVAFGCGVGDELWEWNGTAWSNRTPTTRPPLWPGVRTCCAAASYDTARARTVLFGGWKSPGTYYQDTWEWDGTVWTHATDGPTTLTSHAMTYDEVRELTLVHGGGNGTSWRLTQMLEWSGTAWATRDPSGAPPPGRSQHTMVYEARRQLTIVFAGNTTTAALGDTWEYDGPSRTWTDRSAFTGPHVRAAHAAVFNPDRGTMLVFGGSYPGSPNPTYLNDLWEYQGP